MRKIIDGLAVASFLLSAAVAGSGVYAYLWITNEDNQKELIDMAVGKITENLPIPKMPSATGPALPLGR
jgi:hypothetical protein